MAFYNLLIYFNYLHKLKMVYKFSIISWMIEQLRGVSKTNPNYVTEIFMHLADSNNLPDAQKLDVLTYGMPQRKMEYLTLMSQDIKTMLHKLYEGSDLQLGSYRKLMQGKQVEYKI